MPIIKQLKNVVKPSLVLSVRGLQYEVIGAAGRLALPWVQIMWPTHRNTGICSRLFLKYSSWAALRRAGSSGRPDRTHHSHSVDHKPEKSSEIKCGKSDTDLLALGLMLQELQWTLISTLYLRTRFSQTLKTAKFIVHVLQNSNFYSLE